MKKFLSTLWLVILTLYVGYFAGKRSADRWWTKEYKSQPTCLPGQVFVCAEQNSFQEAHEKDVLGPHKSSTKEDLEPCFDRSVATYGYGDDLYTWTERCENGVIVAKDWTKQPQRRLAEEQQIKKARPGQPHALYFSQWFINPSSNSYPYELKLIVRTNVDRDHVQLLVACSGDIEEARAELEKDGPFAVTGSHQAILRDVVAGPTREHPDLFVVKWQAPAWKVGHPLTIHLWSKSKIVVANVIPVVYR